MDNMRSAVAILVRACAVFFLFSIMYNTSTYALYLPVYNILTYHVARSLSYSYMYVLFFDRRCFLGFAVMCDGGSRGNVGRSEKYVVKIK